MPKGEFYSKTLEEKFADGTGCDKTTYNMCVDGVCEAASCDLIIVSNAGINKCISAPVQNYRTDRTAK